MCHFHGTELQEGFSQGNATEQHLSAQHRKYTIIMRASANYLHTLLELRAPVPVTDVAGAIFVCGAAGAAADAVHVLVALG